MRIDQSIIRSHANDPGPEDVVVVRMVVNAEQTHGRNVIGAVNVGVNARIGTEGAPSGGTRGSVSAELDLRSPMPCE